MDIHNLFPTIRLLNQLMFLVLVALVLLLLSHMN